MIFILAISSVRPSSVNLDEFSSLYFSIIFSFISSSLLYFSCLSLILKALSTSSLDMVSISFTNSSDISSFSYSIFSSPISFIILFSKLTNFFTASWPNIKASSMSSSLTSLADDSTMFMASLVPATVKSMSDFSDSSVFGLIISLPSTLPTLTPATGPLNGILLTETAKDDPKRAASSGELSGSTDKTVFTICTSFLKSSGNKGLIGRSIIRAAKVAASLGLPSLLINPPGILPTEYNFSWYKTISGKKSDNRLTFFETTTVDKTTVSPYLTRIDASACLATSPVSTTSFLPAKFISNVFFIITSIK